MEMITMKTEKLFTIAGTSVEKGITKFRVATGSIKRRVTVLKMCGNTEIQLQELPEPMTRAAAMAFIGFEKPAKAARVTAPVAVQRTETVEAVEQTAELAAV
jgi:ribosome-interacting GTPase 1